MSFFEEDTGWEGEVKREDMRAQAGGGGLVSRNDRVANLIQDSLAGGEEVEIYENAPQSFKKYKMGNGRRS